MSKIKRVLISDSTDEEDKDLKRLLENYIKKSEELENKESKMLKRVEMIQSAVTSLQAYNDKRLSTRPSSEPVLVNVKEIEEETKKIRQETKRIQKEVREKIEENKKLQDEIEKKKRLKNAEVNDTASDSFIRKMDQEADPKGFKRETSEYRAMNPNAPPELSDDPGIQFFDEKLKKLKEMEKKLKKESEKESEQAKIRKKNLEEKLEMLEWESEIDRQLIQSRKKKLGKK